MSLSENDNKDCIKKIHKRKKSKVSSELDYGKIKSISIGPVVSPASPSYYDHPSFVKLPIIYSHRRCVTEQLKIKQPKLHKTTAIESDLECYKLAGLIRTNLNEESLAELSKAIEKNTSKISKSIAKRLVNSIKSIPVNDSIPNSSLLLALEYGRLDEAIKLRKNRHPANTIAEYDGFGVIHEVAFFRTKEALELMGLLLDKSLGNTADINSKTIGGYTALHFASLSGYSEMVTLLLLQGADLNSLLENGKTARDIAMEAFDKNDDVRIKFDYIKVIAALDNHSRSGIKIIQKPVRKCCCIV